MKKIRTRLTNITGLLCVALIFNGCFIAGCDNIDFQWNGKPGQFKPRETPAVSVSTPTKSSSAGSGMVPAPLKKINRAEPIKKKEEAEALEDRKPLFSPYQGEAPIAVNPARQLGVLSRDDFAQFRKNKVREHEQLQIFPSTYDQYLSGADIYREINFDCEWTEFTKCVVCNPYLLIMEKRDVSRRSFEEDCGLSEVRYKNGVIEVTYRGDQALKFFGLVENEAESSHVISFWTINARDAGFAYTAIDQKQSRNIDFNGLHSTENGFREVYNLKAVFDARSYSLHGVPYNNIAPAGGSLTSFNMIGNSGNKILEWQEQSQYVSGKETGGMALRIKEMGRNTRIFIKLWQNKPASSEDKEDLAYVINVIP
jgi:hypothetical protein